MVFLILSRDSRSTAVISPIILFAAMAYLPFTVSSLAFKDSDVSPDLVLSWSSTFAGMDKEVPTLVELLL